MGGSHDSARPRQQQRQACLRSRVALLRLASDLARDVCAAHRSVLRPKVCRREGSYNFAVKITGDGYFRSSLTIVVLTISQNDRSARKAPIRNSSSGPIWCATEVSGLSARYGAGQPASFRGSQFCSRGPSNPYMARSSDWGLIHTVPSVSMNAHGKSRAGRLACRSWPRSFIRRPRRRCRDQARRDIRDHRVVMAQRLPLSPRRSWRSMRRCPRLAGLGRELAAACLARHGGNDTRLSCGCCGNLAR